MGNIIKQMVSFLGGIKLTVFLLFTLFLLILFATFAQVDYGIFEANKRYFTSWFVWLNNVPIFLGGFSIGLLLIINLLLSHATKFRFKLNYLGIFCIHFGLVLLILGSAITSFFGEEMQIAVKEKSSKNYLDYPNVFELVIIDPYSNEDFDSLYIYSISELLKGINFNGVSIKVNSFYENAIINQRGIESLRYNQLGQLYKLIPLPKTYKMDERNVPGVDVDISSPDSVSKYIFWGGSDVYQDITINEKAYLIKLRSKRAYLPFSIYLDDFTKVDYMRSETAKQFISNVLLKTNDGDIPFTIEMNQPLRYSGYTFFQSSYTEDRETSVFQVVKNPSWQVPYISSLLIVIGLLIQMTGSMRRKS
ncbi:MAG: cytochrome c biogenesis protein ResB [Candidatus Margulisiibacteriota bacterium]|nr:cytochrome c biogenesis protein ResB [Candidatus Margulisiibacteriota bacterium]